MSIQQEIRTFKVVITRLTEDGVVTRKHTMHGVNQSEIIKNIKRDYALADCWDWKINIRECTE